jgi:hypothetical protein
MTLTLTTYDGTDIELSAMATRDKVRLSFESLKKRDKLSNRERAQIALLINTLKEFVG